MAKASIALEGTNVVISVSIPVAELRKLLGVKPDTAKRGEVLATDLIMDKLRKSKASVPLSELRTLTMRHGFGSNSIYRVVETLVYKGLVKRDGHAVYIK